MEIANGEMVKKPKQSTDRKLEKKRQKPKVLVLTTSYPSDEKDPSGIFIAKLLGALKRRGYELRVVAPSNGQFYGRRFLSGIETVRFGYFFPRFLERLTIGAGGIPENMAKSFLAKLQVLPMMFVFLLKTVSEARHMDLIYANWLGAGIVGAVAGMLTRKPLVVSFRGDDGYLARDRYIWRKLTKFVTGRASLIVPVSRELRDIILDLGIPREKCRVPRFGVDVEMFHPPSEPRPVREHVRILFVGSLIARKGLHDLLEALADPELATARLTIVGDGPDLEKLRAQSDGLGLTDNTEWKGLLPPETVARMMRHTDLVCLPSYMEGRPNVVNEAMASGLPVISTRIGGIPDMVKEWETAFLVEPGDVEELRKCLIRLVSDPDLRARMGAAGHEFLVKSGVSWDSTAEEFDALFSSL